MGGGWPPVDDRGGWAGPRGRTRWAWGRLDGYGDGRGATRAPLARGTPVGGTPASTPALAQPSPPLGPAPIVQRTAQAQERIDTARCPVHPRSLQPRLRDLLVPALHTAAAN